MWKAALRKPWRTAVISSSAVAVTGTSCYLLLSLSDQQAASSSSPSSSSSNLSSHQASLLSRFRDLVASSIISTTSSSQIIHADAATLPPPIKQPSRKEMLNLLKGLNVDGSIPTPATAADPNIHHPAAGGDFDLLIVGDAVSRGLKVAMVERDDFASGELSNRDVAVCVGDASLLGKAFLELDYEQYKLVVEALHERGVFLKIAPYLSYQLPIMLPIYQYWKIPYYWAGSKAYDILAGSEGLSRSYFLSKRKALEAFPMLKTDKLVGAMVYYDGAHNDSRLGDDEIYGAVVKDNLTGETWTVRAKGIINATGPFTDGLRKLDGGVETKEIVAPSAGVHIILPNYYSPRRMGLVDPSTSDGRVIFFLPWQGNTIAGTTDSPTTVSPNPLPQEKDVSWILKEIENYLDPAIKVRRGDVLAAWSGIRPLVRDPAAKNTAALVRNHMINVSESGLLTIAGGKWTTYRAMAQETVDRAIEVFDLRPTGPCQTERILLVGSHGWSQNMFIKLIQTFGLETEVAQHLADSYGDRAFAVASLATLTGRRWPVFGTKLDNSYPYIEAEVRYAVQYEYACTAVDVLARRTRLAFLNSQAAKDALPRVIDIMTEELSWSPQRRTQEYDDAIAFLKTMGLGMGTDHPDDATFFSRSHFTADELIKYRAEFNKFDNKRGVIGEKELGKILGRLGVELGTSGVVLGAVKDVKIRARIAAGLPKEQEHREQFSTIRSGGGV
ncbi:FAD dependent oxidoreductase-domain-containing protein [Chytridium lagenaria]|nr:FAD dependent oxidoreductase-domain-containing protein [Chytridium lagenaria]